MSWVKPERNPARVLPDLITRSDDSVVTKSGCKIYFPVRFAERFLADLGMENICVGMFPIVVGNYYTLINVNAYLSLNPSLTTKTPIDGVDYYCLTFEPGSIVIKTLELVQNSDIIFRLYDELYSKGKIPWYVGYEDLGSLFDTAKKFAGANVGENAEVVQLLASIVSRDPENRVVYYRQTVNTQADVRNKHPAYVPLRSVYYSATNTVSKLAGSYFADGVTSALINPSDRVEQIEEILRA